MKIGILGLRADNRGLARQMDGFVRFLEPTKVLGLDLTTDNLSPYPCNWSSYLSIERLEVARPSQLTEKYLRSWLKGLDVVLGAETFYADQFPAIAAQEGVRTVLQVNPEFCPWANPDPRENLLPAPDVLIAPTSWRINAIPNGLVLPYPVDRERFPFRLRTEANRFVHVGGHAAMGDRAGSQLVMNDLSFIRDRTKLVVTMRTQSGFRFQSHLLSSAIVLTGNLRDPLKLFRDHNEQEADVLIQPRRYGGQSLIANEALSQGIPLITLDREPEWDWPGTYRVPSHIRSHLRTKGGNISLYDCYRGSIADAVAKLHEDPSLVKQLSEDADRYAQKISWDALLPVYKDFLHAVAKGEDHVRVLRRYGEGRVANVRL